MKLTTTLFLALSVALLSGCAVLNQVASEVSSYGDWPAERKPGSYAFERLPSQQDQAQESDRIEAAAALALQRAGFTPVNAGQAPDVLVQVALRTHAVGVQPWDDPLWWRGGFGYWHHGPWLSPRWSLSMRSNIPRYEREVALLMRERTSGKPLFEARASNQGNTQTSEAVTAAMFAAALKDFPQRGINPRRVVVALPL